MAHELNYPQNEPLEKPLQEHYQSHHEPLEQSQQPPHQNYPKDPIENSLRLLAVRHRFVLVVAVWLVVAVRHRFVLVVAVLVVAVWLVVALLVAVRRRVSVRRRVQLLWLQLVAVLVAVRHWQRLQLLR